MIRRFSFTILNHMWKSKEINPLWKIQKCQLCTAVAKLPKENLQIQPSLLEDALSEEDFFGESSVLADTNEDFSEEIANAFPSYNFAPYVNTSETLQSMIKLGVSLHKISKQPKFMNYFIGLDFEKDMKPYLRFLGDYVEPEQLGNFLTKNPIIFKNSLEDLEVRINYLRSKRFGNAAIKRIVTLCPFWLQFSSKRIDRRLGHFQKTFELTGDEVRYLTTKQPRLIIQNFHSIKVNTFSFKEEFGFDDKQIKKILLDKPKLWMLQNVNLVRRFNYVHNYMNISHEKIAATPQILLSRQFRIQQRHSFLEKIGKAQYDPTKPNFVPLIKLVEGTDAEFCFEVAKCPVSDFNLFLKTM